jgi:hypothetical protein
MIYPIPLPGGYQTVTLNPENVNPLPRGIVASLFAMNGV